MCCNCQCQCSAQQRAAEQQAQLYAASLINSPGQLTSFALYNAWAVQNSNPERDHWNAEAKRLKAEGSGWFVSWEGIP